MSETTVVWLNKQDSDSKGAVIQNNVCSGYLNSLPRLLVKSSANAE